jgi:thymidylate kinase
MMDEMAEPRARDSVDRYANADRTASDDRDWVPPFLRALFRALDDADIRWVVLRKHEDLPDRVGHDVDIVVHPADHARIDDLVRAVVRKRGLFLLRVDNMVECYAFDVAASDLGGRLFLHLDLHTAVRYRGRLLVDAEDLLTHRRFLSEGLWALSPGMEAYALLLHAALHKAALKQEYASRLVALEDAAPRELLRVATGRLGTSLGRRLANVRTETQLLGLRKELGRALDRRYPGNLWRRPSSNVRRGVRMIRLRLRPRGVLVVFLGPDGSGKTSTTELLVKMLSIRSNALPVHRIYLGSGSPLLPTRKLMRWYRSKTASEDQNPEQLRDVRPRPLRGGLHVMADEIVRYWLHVRPQLSPHGIVLADRYAYDVFRVNNATVRRRWFRRVATAVIPTPDITFFLEGDPVVIAERKEELTLAETIRQQREYRQLASLVPEFRPIDLTVRDDAALRGVALQILDVFAARNGGLPRNESSASSGAP